MSLPSLLLIVIGMLLIWAAIKNLNPIQAVKDVLQGKNPSGNSK